MKKPVKPQNSVKMQKVAKNKSTHKPSKASTPPDNSENFFSLLGEPFESDIRIDLDAAFNEDDSAVELFIDFLDACKSDDLSDDDRNDLISDLLEALTDLRVGANNGDRSAREDIQEIYDLLEDDLDEKALSLPDIMMVGKIFSDAGLDVPEILKQSAADAFEAFSPTPHEIASGDILSPFREVIGQAQENPFEAYEFMVSMLASFPTEYGLVLLHELIFQKDAKLNHALLGFLLHPDPAYCEAVASGLTQMATNTQNESLAIERLLRMRPWEPESRQSQIDTVIKAMRQKALPPVQATPPKLIKCYASACDGAGTMTIMATMRSGQSYQICSFMNKITGVSDVLVLEHMPKMQMDMIIRQLKTSIQTHEINLDGIRRLLGLAIAENHACEVLPPFRLVAACELLGIGAIPPDHSSITELFSYLLAELRPNQIDKKAIENAHQFILDCDLTENWFEAGEAVESLLYPVKGKARRVKKVLNNYLPARRDFWARQCAFSALALCGDKKTATANSLWLQLALVGRDIASDRPLDEIPLMIKIAAITVEAFEYQE